VNRQIVQMFGLTIALFAILIVFTSRWTVFEAESLEDKTANRRPLIEEQQIERGRILARDGRTLLARSVPEGRGQRRIFVREYPNGPLLSHPVGYSFISQGRAGIERERNDELTGEEDEFESIISELQSDDREGNDVVTTLDPNAQQVATDALGGQNGAVVALEPQTGRVRAMVSIPQYDNNLIPSSLGQLRRDQDSPLLNRATQAQYPPGSTFKVVTATAALDTGKYNPDSIIDGSSPKEISGVPLANSGGVDFGPIPLTDALTNSVNTVFAQLGEDVGPGTLEDYMDRYGFNQDPQLDYPEDQMVASGVYAGGRVVGADAGFDVGRVAIGQGGAEGGILVTPLQMAQVAGTVANRGVLMKPRLTERVVAKDGRVKDTIDPDEQNRVMKEETAEQLAAMMSRVVEEGTGTAAALSGINVAGKTGTAEVDNATSNQAWFIGFAPVEDPRVAVAVTVERTQGQGGTVAAPIAAQVMEALL
jgi:peptidoglycan glycosyltransferase